MPSKVVKSMSTMDTPQELVQLLGLIIYLPVVHEIELSNLEI